MAVREADDLERGLYPWDEWCDGTTWTCTEDEDFDVSANVFRSYLYEVASKRGLSVTTQIKEHSVTFQFKTINNNKKEVG